MKRGVPVSGGDDSRFVEGEEVAYSKKFLSSFGCEFTADFHPFFGVRQGPLSGIDNLGFKVYGDGLCPLVAKVNGLTLHHYT